MKEKTLQESMVIIKAFADRFGLTFEKWGTIGFGRKCVGFTLNSYYVEYNPINFYDKSQSDFMDFVKELYDERFYEIAPLNADSKSSCLAVMGWGIDSIIELSNWIEKLNEINVIVVKYCNYDGTDRYALKINPVRP